MYLKLICHGSFNPVRSTVHVHTQCTYIESVKFALDNGIRECFDICNGVLF